MNLPTLSVIIPNYNHAQHLPRCLEALLGQSVQPREIIVIDDGSTDNSVEVIRGFARKYPIVKLLQNDRNRGVAYAVNRGMEAAEGDFVYLQAADDETLQNFFEKSLGLLAQHPQAGLCCCIGDWREIATGLTWHMGVGMVSAPSYLPPDRVLELERQGRIFIPTHTVIAKRSALAEAGNYIPDLKDAVDWFAACVISFRYGICVVPEPLCVLQIYRDSFYKRSRQDKKGHRAVLEHVLTLLNQPNYRDVVDFIREAGSLYIFATPMLQLLLSRPEYRHFLTPTFLRKNLFHSLKLALKKLLPPSFLKLGLRAMGYWADAPTDTNRRTENPGSEAGKLA